MTVFHLPCPCQTKNNAIRLTGYMQFWLIHTLIIFVHLGIHYVRD